MGKLAKWRSFSKEQIEKIVKASRSNREVATALGYSPDGGGTMKSLKAMYEELKIDTSHFLGQGWNKENYDYSSFTENSNKKNGKTTREPLVSLRGHRCERCGLTEWLGEKIPLHVHHIDGDHYNNELSNLELLCLNCHGLTKSFCRQKKERKIVPEENFILALKTAPSIHAALKSLGLTPTSGNYVRARELMAKYDIRPLE